MAKINNTLPPLSNSAPKRDITISENSIRGRKTGIESIVIIIAELRAVFAILSKLPFVYSSEKNRSYNVI